MKNTSPKIPSLALVLFLAVTAYAAEDSVSINLSVAHTQYVTLTGTVVGASRTFAESDIKPAANGQEGPTVELGTLGLASNVPGNCALSFTTANNFRLRHLDTNKSLTAYSLFYDGQNIDKKNGEITKSCNSAASPLTFSTNKNYQKNVQTGIYQDKINIVVTTE